MRARDITEGTYGGDSARHPYGRGIRRGDTVRYTPTNATHSVEAVQGGKIALDSGKIVPVKDCVLVKRNNRVDELYDPERKYTGGANNPPPQPPRRGGGPDWGDDNERERMRRAWLVFAQAFEAKLENMGFTIVKSRSETDISVMGYYSTVECGSITIGFKPGFFGQLDTAALNLNLFDSQWTWENKEAEPNRTRRLRVTLDDFDWAVSKVRTEVAVLKACQQKPIRESILTEGGTDVLYHATTSLGARDILRDGEFKLTTSVGTHEHQHTVRNRPYFLSTTRSKIGDYHARYVGNGNTIFALDGRWLGQRYAIRPVDYWSSAWVNNQSGRTRESEDRVYSRENTIPLTPVTSIHVYIQHHSPEQIEQMSSNSSEPYRWDEIREMSQLAEQRGIPVYIYYDIRDWRVQNTQRAEHPEDVIELQHGREPEPRTYTPYQTLARLIELITAQPGDALSPDADRLLYNIRWYSDTYRGLETDMHNSRKPSSTDYKDAVSVANYMTRNKLKNMRELVSALKAKWGMPT